MSERIDLDELREFAEMTRDHPNELVYSDWVLALVEAVEAALAVHNAPRMFASFTHGEADEITCWCGWQSRADDYDKACDALRRHIRREETKTLDAARVRNERLRESLARFGVDT